MDTGDNGHIQTSLNGMEHLKGLSVWPCQTNFKFPLLIYTPHFFFFCRIASGNFIFILHCSHSFLHLNLFLKEQIVSQSFICCFCALFKKRLPTSICGSYFNLELLLFFFLFFQRKSHNWMWKSLEGTWNENVSWGCERDGVCLGLRGIGYGL